MKTVLRIGIARANIELRQLVRDREGAFWTLVFPVVLMVIFGSVFGSQHLGHTGVTFAQYFVAGMIASGVMYTAFQNIAIWIPQERDDGTLKRLRGLPMPKAAYFVGKIGVVLTTFVFQTLVLLLTGALFYGIHIPTGFDTWWRFTWIAALGLTSCTLLGIAFSSLPRTGRGAAAVTTPVVLVLQFGSGVFFRYNDVPHWMQQFAAIFPLKWLTQGMRSVFLPPEAAALEVSHSYETGRTALVLAAWSIAGALLAVRTFRWTRREG